MIATTSRKLTPAEVAELLGISLDQTYRLIRAGDLRAISIGRRGAVKPRLRIDPLDLAAFEQRRAVGGDDPPPRPRAARRRAGLVEYV